jgi:glyoxylate reductase
MQKPKVYLTRNIPHEGIEIMQKQVDIRVWPEELPPDYQTLLKEVQGMDGLVTLLSDKIDQQLIASAGPGLKIISQYAVGVDNIDLHEATRRKIPVGHTPGVLTETTADFAWALLMAAARRVVESDRSTRDGEWKTWGPMTFLGYDVYGATLGIVGFGRIGQAVAKRARGFGMRVLYSDVHRHLDAESQSWLEYMPFEKLLTAADFVTIHTPLSSDTFHLFGDQQFKTMKPSAILVNTARGPIVDPQALYRALKNKTIAYAALDVTEPEPIPLDSSLLQLKNLIIAPHIASASHHTRTKMALMTAENLLAGLRGEKVPYCANPEVYS